MTKKKEKDVIVWNALKAAGFNMDKIKLYYNSVGALCIRDYSYRFFNGEARLQRVDYYNRVVILDVMRPDHLVHQQVKYKF